MLFALKLVKCTRHKKCVFKIPSLVTYEIYISKCFIIVISIFSSIIIPNTIVSNNSFQISSSIILDITFKNSFSKVWFTYVIILSERFGESDSLINSTIEGKILIGKFFFAKK